jgi:hypothetical protein
MGDDAALDFRASRMEDLAREGCYPSGSYLPMLSRGFTAFERGDFSAAIEMLAPLAAEKRAHWRQPRAARPDRVHAAEGLSRGRPAGWRRHGTCLARGDLAHPAFPLRGLRRCTDLQSRQLHGFVPSYRHRCRKLILPCAEQQP